MNRTLSSGAPSRTAMKMSDYIIFWRYIKENAAVNGRVGIIFANYSAVKSALYSTVPQEPAANNCPGLSVKYIPVVKTGVRHGHQVNVTDK